MRVITEIERDGLVKAVSQAADAIVITDIKGKIRYVNPAFTTMTGYTREEAIGQFTSILKSGCQPAAFYERLWNTISSGQVWHDEVINRRRDGTLYREEMRISPVRDADGQIVSYIAIKHDVSEQRAAEEAQRFLAAIVKGSEDAIIAFTPGGAILTWNRGAETLFGYTAAEAIGNRISMLTTPEEPHLSRFTAEILQAKAIPHYEDWGLRKDGQRIHISVAMCPIHDSAGKVTAVSAILRNVTKRKEAEEALRESEERFRVMADSCPAPMWVSDAEGQVQFINLAYREFFGIAKDWLGIFKREVLAHPDDAAAYFTTFRRAVAERSAFRAEARVRRADGAWRWVTSYAEPRRSASGAFLGHGGITLDITDRKQTEQAVRDSHEFAQATIDALSSHVCVMSEKGTIIAVNHAWKANSRVNRNNCSDEALREPAAHVPCSEGMTCRAQCAEMSGPGAEGGAEFAAGLQSVLDGKRRTFALEYTCHSPGAEQSFIGRVTRFQSGRLPRILIEHINITDLKLAQEISTKARQAAEEANQAKSRFLATMSHEIRTPMNAILGMADVLWESELDGEQRQCVEVFRRAGSNLLTLINDILDLSKVETGQLELEQMAFNLEEVTDQVIELIGVKTRSKGIVLSCHLSPEVPTCLMGDPMRLRQVLTNLLGNAAKFTDSGEIVFRIQNHASGKAGEIEFAVSDTGIGIPPEKLEMIFDAFSQGADASMTRKFGGTGLGLGISRKLVESMGGRLTVTSSPGAGSTFRFSLQFALDPQSRKADSELGDFLGRRVLVIEGNATDRLILRETFGAWGLRTEAFASPREALADLARTTAREQPYALAVLNRQMSDTDGFEAATRIRKVAPDLPIVMLTSDARPGDVKLRGTMGLSGYAVKPVKRADLLRLICDALNKRGEGLKPPSHEPTSRAASEVVKPLRILVAEDSPDNRLLLQIYLKGSCHQVTSSSRTVRARWSALRPGMSN